MGDSSSPNVQFGRSAPTIPVTDIQQALGFCASKLGMEKVFESGDPVGFVILHRDVSEIHLTLDPEHTASTRNFAHILVSETL